MTTFKLIMVKEGLHVHCMYMDLAVFTLHVGTSWGAIGRWRAHRENTLIVAQYTFTCLQAAFAVVDDSVETQV